MQPREFAAGQEFLVAAKRYWSTTLYRNLRARFDELAASDPSGFAVRIAGRSASMRARASVTATPMLKRAGTTQRKSRISES